MKKKALFATALAVAAAYFLVRSLMSLPDPHLGVYALEARGHKFVIALLENGIHSQTLEVPGGAKFSSSGTWKIVYLRNRKYLVATDVYLGDICWPNHERRGELPEKSEINSPILLSFWFEPYVMLCSEGRGLFRE